MDPETKRKLLEELRAAPKPRDPAEAGRNAAANTRRIMLNRGLTESISKGDATKAEKYRKENGAGKAGREGRGGARFDF
jgi:hypothetical protein